MSDAKRIGEDRLDGIFIRPIMGDSAEEKYVRLCDGADVGHVEGGLRFEKVLRVEGHPPGGEEFSVLVSP